MNLKPAIKLTGATKVFDRPKLEPVVAVNAVSFSVFEGEIFGLLGPNGAGKTTTLRMISTVLKPTSGHILVGGFDTATQSDEVRRKLGFLSGATGLYKKLKARETVEFFGRLYGIDEDSLKKRTDELFKMLGMEEFAEVYCEALSTGTKQKVNIARTIVHDPPIMIFDEPTAGLDVMVARTLTNFIRGLKNQGKAVIFSTHIMREAERLCDRIGILHNGKLLSIGTLDEILVSTGAKDLEEAFFALAERPEGAR